MRRIFVLLVVSMLLVGCSGDGAVTLRIEGGNDIFRKGDDPRQNMDWYVSRRTESKKFSGMGSN